MSTIKAIGIDLGTTYSSASIINDFGEPEILPNFEGERLTPSVVFFDDKSVVVGQIAKDAAESAPEQVVMFVKRQMGDPHWFYKYNGQKLMPEDVSAFILGKIKKDAELALGYSIPYAVITVPAYFDDDRRRATINAGKIAGFKEILGLINEPTAAAIAFGLQHNGGDETVMVYDLGGGTFDVTLLRVEDNGENIKIIASDGDHQLGGKDFDDAIIRLCVAGFQQEHGFDPTIDPCEMQQLRKDAEKAKKELSARNRTMVMVRAKGKRSRIVITLEEFEEAIKPKIDTTFSLIRNTLRDAGCQAEDIDRVLLIGGSTRIPLVRRDIQSFFGKEPDVSVNPDEAVSFGAAIMAAKKFSTLAPEEINEAITDKVAGLQITDVVSHSLGIEAMTMDGRKMNTILIRRNSPIPTETSKEFITTLGGQTGIKVIIYQGEFPDPQFCNPVGEFILGGLPPNRPPGKKVRVTVACTNDGTVEVTALDIESGRKASTQVSYKTGQSQTQVSAKSMWMQTQTIE